VRRRQVEHPDLAGRDRQDADTPLPGDGYQIGGGHAGAGEQRQVEAGAVEVGLGDAAQEVVVALGLDAEGRLAVVEPAGQVGVGGEPVEGQGESLERLEGAVAGQGGVGVDVEVEDAAAAEAVGLEEGLGAPDDLDLLHGRNPNRPSDHAR
jgi:hypothetical protein